MINLDKYYPQIDVFQYYEVKEELEAEELAFAEWGKLLEAKRSYQALFLVIGKKLKRFRDEKLYEYHDFGTFTEFLGSEELGFSREKAYLCIRAYEYFIEHLGLSENMVGQMNISRINMMMPVIKKIEAESGKEAAIEQIEDYNALRHSDFVREIKLEKKSKKPSVYFLEETNTWRVDYYENVTNLRNLGVYEETSGQETD